MANPGNDTSTPQEASKQNQSILVVILVVVLSILALCLTGIALVVYYRRRMRGKKYTRIRPPADSSDITAIDDSNSHHNHNSGASSDSPWNSFLRRMLLLRPASPDVYDPIQLPNGRPPPPKVSVQFGDPNIPRSPPTTDSSFSVPRRPIQRPTITPTPAPPSRTPIRTHLRPPLSPSRSHTAPIISQSVVRIAPMPDNSTPRIRPVRAPSAPIVLPLPNREPSPSRQAIEVLNITRPSHFTIDDTPSSSAKGIDAVREKRRRLPNNTLHGPSRSDGHVVTKQGLIEATASRIRRLSLSTQSATRTQDSDSLIDPLSAMPSDDAGPISAVSSASTTASIAGSSRPPTLTIRNLLRSVTPAHALPSLQLPGPLSLSYPSSGQGTPNQVPGSQTSTPPRTRQQHLAQSQSPPHHHVQFGGSQLDRQPSQTSQYPPDHIRRHPSEAQLRDQRGATRPPNNQEQGRLFPQAVVSAGYQTRRGPSPLQSGATDPRRLPSNAILPTPVPPPTPNSWAPLRTNRP